MTAAAASNLTGTDPEVWSREVVGSRESATCEAYTIVFSDGPRTPTRAYVSITAERTVRSSSGATREEWRDDRKLTLLDGRWLVDVAVSGG